jgi:RNA polymerase sigma factor (sigma-70 family)
MLHGKNFIPNGNHKMSEKEESTAQLGLLLESLRQDPADENLWRDLYGRIRRFVYAVAYRVVNGDQELAKDATQVVFQRLFEYSEFTEFVDPNDFVAYVATIARHAALDLVKKEGRYVTGLDLTLCDFLPGSITPQQHQKAQGQLHDLLEQLNSDDKILVNLLMEGHTLDEISEQLQISYANAAVRIHRLRERLANAMKTR